MKRLKTFEGFEIKQFKDIEWYNQSVYPLTMNDYVQIELPKDFFNKYKDEDNCLDFEYFLTNTPGKIVEFYGVNYISLEYPFDNDKITWEYYYLTYDQDLSQHFFMCNVEYVIYTSKDKEDVEKQINKKKQSKKFKL